MRPMATHEKPYYRADDIYPDWSIILKQRKKRGLPRCKRLARKMWSGHLVSSKLGGLLFVTQLERGLLRPCMR
jgi:hypothetical protein